MTIIDVSLAYTHTLLSFRLSSLSASTLSEQQVGEEEVKTEIETLAPFLVQPKSTERYTSVRECWGAVWEGIIERVSMWLDLADGKSEDPPDRALLIRLLETLRTVIHPSILLSSTSKISLVLSDLHHLYSTKGITKKLLFYCSATTQLTRATWLAIEKEVQKEIDQLNEETAPDEQASLN